jgi:hypothetical protein
MAPTARSVVLHFATWTTTFCWNIEMRMKVALSRLRILEIPMPYRRRTESVSMVAWSLRGSAKAADRIAATIRRVVTATQNG